MKFKRVIFRNSLHKTYYEKAIKNRPDDGICFWCKKKNYFADDCGFFYICGSNDRTIQKVCCERCHNGGAGKIHIERFGIGER